MTNQEIAKIFYEIALYLEMQDVAFKPPAPKGRGSPKDNTSFRRPARGRGSPKMDTTRFRWQAYEKAALNLETLSEDVEDVYKKSGINALKEIPGIGENLAEKIVEYIKTGKIKEYEALKKKMPVNIEELTSVEGIGPKMVRDLYKNLKIKNLSDLEKNAKAGKIRNIKNFGEKTEQNILESIEFLKRSKGRFLLGEILPKVQNIIEELKRLKEVKQISEAGSVRRRKETIGDVDILITSSDAKKVIDYFVSMPGVIKIWGKGPTKASVRLKENFDVDLRVLPEKQFGSALQYFTGSKEHNIILRKIAIEKGLKLNEYGLFRGPKMISGKTEKEVYSALKMDYIEPELRENTGEIEAALRQAQGKPSGLPKILNYNAILGDLHVHSNWNGGENSIEELAKEAMEMGYQYIGISDHTKFLRIENGLNEKQLLKRNIEIDKLNSRLRQGFGGQAKFKNKNFKILKGCEANIMADGSIDINDETLAKMDFVIAGVHSQMKMPKEKMTARIITAMKNRNVDIISHPTGRILKKRDEYEIDFDKILEAAKHTNTILEINSSPDRLDLKDTNIKKAKETGVKMVINTDSHQIGHLRLMEFGISQARRGWAEKKDIINAWPMDKMLKMLK